MRTHTGCTRHLVVIFLLLAATYVAPSSGLKCYRCDSNESKCLDPTKNKDDTSIITQCDALVKFCFKSYDSSTSFMMRGCNRDDLHTPKEKCMKVEEDSKTIRCFCRNDLCNNEPGLEATKGDIAVPPPSCSSTCHAIELLTSGLFIIAVMQSL